MEIIEDLKKLDVVSITSNGKIKKREEYEEIFTTVLRDYKKGEFFNNEEHLKSANIILQDFKIDLRRI